MAENPTNPTQAAQQKFLKAFARHGNVTRAAKAARVDRSTPYDWQEKNEVFAAAWESAKGEAADVLEAEALRRAVTGTRKGIYHKGVLVATEKQYSDALLTLLLKANRPDKFRERSSVDYNGKLDVGLKYLVGVSEDDI